jgi:CRISPR-associated protein Csb2
MPTSIHIRFLTGRAHLHPWHAAPNEGRVEWPPSPWRLLRTLVAVAGRGLTTLPESDSNSFSDDWFAAATTITHGSGKRQQSTPDPFWSQHKDKFPLTELAALLHMLSAPPIVWLPRSGVGHTRHFFRTKSGRTTGSAVFDTFAAIDPQQSLIFEWSNLNLEKSVTETIEMLLSRLMYFGRSESWCEAALQTEPFHSGNAHCPCVAIEDTGAFETHFAKPGQCEYRDYSIEKRLGWNPEPNSLQFLKDKFKAASATETELLLRSLLQLSGDSMKHGDRPWGTRWLHYAVPKEIFRLPTRRTPRVIRDSSEELQPRPDCQVIRYAISTGTVHRAVLPAITTTLAIAQRCRAAALSIFGRQNERRCSPQLSGKRLVDDKKHYALFAESDNDAVIKFGDENGGHAAHAYWWPVDEDGDGFLDHLIVLCHDGFSAKDMSALRTLNRVQQHGNRHDLLLTPIFEGKWNECPDSFFSRNKIAQIFVSATPYFCPLHLSGGKSGGKNRPKLSNIIREAVRKIPCSGSSQIIAVEELVFDYDPASLGRRQNDDPRRCVIAHLHAELTDNVGGVVAERGDIVAATLDVPLPTNGANLDNTCYQGASVRDPDDPRPLGLSRGLFVSRGQRFVPALEFQRMRSPEDRAKGPGLMLRVIFESPQRARPFAIGQFCHFGLGLFVPVSTA